VIAGIFPVFEGCARGARVWGKQSRIKGLGSEVGETQGVGLLRSMVRDLGVGWWSPPEPAWQRRMDARDSPNLSTHEEPKDGQAVAGRNSR